MCKGLFDYSASNTGADSIFKQLLHPKKRFHFHVVFFLKFLVRSYHKMSFLSVWIPMKCGQVNLSSEHAGNKKTLV